MLLRPDAPGAPRRQGLRRAADGIAPEHALSPDYGLRPLFASLEGVPALTIYATDAVLESGEPSEALAECIHRAAEQAIQLARGLGPGEA